MAGKGKASKGKPRGGRAPAKSKRAPKAARPALGNDPFERGAAMRPPAPLQVEMAEVAQPDAVEAPSTPPSPSTSTLPPDVRVEHSEGSSDAPPILPEPPASEPQPEPPPPISASVAAAAASLRDRLDVIERRLEAELERVSEVAQGAASRLGEFARAEADGEHAHDVGKTVAGLLPGLRERLAGLAAAPRVFEGPGPADAFGMDRDLAERAAPILEFLYQSWWRVAVRDIDAVPATGPAVIVANHGGALPWDAFVLRVALRRDHAARRELRPLLDDHALAMPIAGGLATRLGAVRATPENALRLLEAGTALAVFPEGSRTGQRPWPDRYRIRQFGRGGFVKLALRVGAPIVPCAIVGSEETTAPFTRAGWLADRLGIPALPSAALPLGPLRLLPLPSRWSLRFGEPIATAPLGADAASDPARVLELTERTRAALQEMLDADVAARRTVYL